ncbi:EGG CELL 1.4 [Hibiscus trionum]|uniref:EGG CELL 1.4 n=1 Tax=Hibiscus trionum TaxID=183268 RepID=A0A9W7J8M0_HIBTR|nr:EGG CELL 1.4 [Hibiscus trionum]
MALRDLFHLLVLVCCLLASGASARQLSSSDKPGRTLAARLDDNRDLSECWSALNELKSCTDEIIIFFVNGQTDIDSECCRAIEVITRNCWPAMLTSIGFTSEEGNILRGYCDASPAPAPAPAAAPLAGSPISPVPAV